MQSKVFCVIMLFSFCLSLKIHEKKHGNFSRQNHKKSQNQHNYYNIEQTNRVSESRSIKYLNKCKDLCLEMHQIFPFQFKFHRLVYRQPDGIMKYITGECLYTFKNDQEKKDINQTTFQQQKNKFQENKTSGIEKQKKWFQWKELKYFIDLSTVQDEQSKQQKKAFTSYFRDCEDQQLKLSQSSRLDFKFTLVHSDFQYFENQGFENLSPFDDFDELLNGLEVPGM